MGAGQRVMYLRYTNRPSTEMTQDANGWGSSTEKKESERDGGTEKVEGQEERGRSLWRISTVRRISIPDCDFPSLIHPRLGYLKGDLTGLLILGYLVTGLLGYLDSCVQQLEPVRLFSS